MLLFFPEGIQLSLEAFVKQFAVRSTIGDIIANRFQISLNELVAFADHYGRSHLV